PRPALLSFPTRRSSDLGDVHQLSRLVSGQEDWRAAVHAANEHGRAVSQAEFGGGRVDDHAADAFSADDLRESMALDADGVAELIDRKSTRLNSSHLVIS